jgi:hypothetical protein
MTWRKAMGCCSARGVTFVVESRMAGGVDHPVGIGSCSWRWSQGRRHHPVQELAPSGELWSATCAKSRGRACDAAVCSRSRTSNIVPSWRLAASLAYLALFVRSRLSPWFHLLTCADCGKPYHFMMPPLGMLFGWLLLEYRSR